MMVLVVESKAVLWMDMQQAPESWKNLRLRRCRFVKLHVKNGSFWTTKLHARSHGAVKLHV